ncbi:sensor histidine kinase [Sphingomonas sp. PB1R3]|uniref:sensor histidine kinase n=1 Tax=Sphingomonas flavida TaxID=3096154 RepID=UPI002FCC1D2D
MAILSARRAAPLVTSVDVRLTMDLGDEPLLARLNDGAFGQTLDNLMNNAVRYTPLGGVVTVTVARDDDRLVVSVRDQGPGIDDVTAKGLFKKFSRGRVPDRGIKAGTGMGLFMVATLATRMGIAVRHVPDREEGTCFLLSIPDTGQTR